MSDYLDEQIAEERKIENERLKAKLVQARLEIEGLKAIIERQKEALEQRQAEDEQ